MFLFPPPRMYMLKPHPSPPPHVTVSGAGPQEVVWVR